MRIKGWGWWALLCAEWALAQAPAPLQDPGQHSVRIVRTTAAPPVIDGKLDEAVWATAALVDDLHQTTPDRVRRCPTSAPRSICSTTTTRCTSARGSTTPSPTRSRRTTCARADNVGQDDRFYVTLDPFNNRAQRLLLRPEPERRARRRALSERHRVLRRLGQRSSTARPGRFEGGWIAEIAIPFKSISFDPTTDTWGLNFSRGVVRKNENIAWVSRNRAYNPAVSGLVTSASKGSTRAGSTSCRRRSLRETRIAGRRQRSSDFEPSLDLVYKITPQLNGSLTINTDFSATEVDDRQVNLTRFGLFFPEKRDFFLREADIFEFGRIGAQQDNISVGAAVARERPAVLLAAHRLERHGADRRPRLRRQVSGRVGEWDIGALSIRQDEFEYDARNPQTGAYAPVRFGPETLSVVARSSACSASRRSASSRRAATRAATSTTRSPAPTSTTATRACRAAARSRPTPGISRATRRGSTATTRAFGVGVRVPSSNRFRGGVGVKQLEANFNPALGFVDRVGVDVTSFDVGYTHRPPRGSYVQSLFTSLDGERVDQLGGGLQTQTMTLRPFLLTNRTGDTLMMVVSRSVAIILPADFAISSEIDRDPARATTASTISACAFRRAITASSPAC